MHNSKYKLNIFIPFAIFFLIFISLFVYSSKYQQEDSINNDKVALTTNFDVELQKQIEYESKVLDGYIEIFKYDEKMQKLYKSGDFEGLYSYASNFFEDLHGKIDLTHFYFLKPDGQVFLRMHDKVKNGDIVKRFTFIQSQKNQAPFAGIEYGIKQNLTLRTVHPWIVDGKLIGYIELGKEIDKVISKLSQLYKIEFYLAIDKTLYKDKPEMLKKFPIFGGYAVAYNTFKLPQNMQMILNEPENLFNTQIDDREFITQTKDFTDVSGKVLGKIVFLVDTTIEHHYMMDGLKNLIFIIIAISIVILALLYFYFRKKEKDINYFTSELAVMAATFESSDAIVVSDKNCVIQKVNNAYCDLTGYEFSEAIGKNTNILKSGNHDKTYYENMWNRIYNSGYFEGELTNKRKSGEEFIAWLTVTAIKDSDGKITNFVGIFRDITKQKELESTLLAAKLQAEQASHSKSEFVANMSHEIRTPMNAIIGLTRLVLESDLNFTQRDYLNKVYTSSTALLGVINDILDYSKIEARKLEIERVPFELEEVIRNVANLFIVKAEEKGIDLLVDIDLNIPNVVIGDPMRLTQVMNNLVGNALKFTNHGEIVLKANLVDETEDNFVVKVSVKDTGIGISQERQKDLFDPFNQVDTSFTRRFGGTGLGLTISKHLAELMGGNIELQSELGVGSEFSFNIYFGKSKTSSKTLFEPLDERLRILIVDDHQTSLDILSNLLKAWNIEISTALNGEDAIDQILISFDEQKPFDTILLDYKMPKMSGFDVVESLKEKQTMNIIPSLPKIVMMSAYAKDECANNLACVSINEFLIKPISPSSLYNTIVKHNGDIKNQPNMTLNDVYNSTKIIHGAKVLLVEDNELNQLVAATLLKKMGLEVSVASDGQIATQMVAKENFDIVFMDLQMPVMDGFEATKYIKEVLKSDVIIVALSAAAMVQDKQLCKDAGMVDFIAKPFMPQDVANVLLKWVKPTTNKVKNSGFTITNNQNVDEIKIDGFNLQSIFQKFDNDVEFVLSLLKGFVVSVRKDNDLENISELISQNNFEQASKIVHKLKGVSGNIGASELFAVCSSFEKELRANDTAKFKSFKTVFNATVKSLENYFDSQSTKSCIMRISNPSQEQIDSVYLILDELEFVCHKNKMVDSALNDKLTDILAPMIESDIYDELISCVNNLDYKGALVIINEIKNKGFA